MKIPGLHEPRIVELEECVSKQTEAINKLTGICAGLLEIVSRAEAKIEEIEREY